MILFEHKPVLPDEAVAALNIKPTGIYVDGTLGGGGHSALILENLTSGKLIGIDRDEDALEAASKRLSHSPNFLPRHGNFHDLPTILREMNIDAIDGVLLDLGVSSHQIDTPERGFSFRQNGPLDMRMDKSMKLTAADIVNNYVEKEIAALLFNFGEERNSRRIARAICAKREISPITTTLELASIIERTSPARGRAGAPHPAMRSFMALRIAVNDELSPLETVLKEIVSIMTEGGRLAVITFHSLEDRIVKATFGKLASPCECPRDIPYCVCEKKPALRVLTRKPITPSKEEIDGNSRAHSAKLRVGERI